MADADGSTGQSIVPDATLVTLANEFVTSIQTEYMFGDILHGDFIHYGEFAKWAKM